MILPSLWFSETSVNCFLALKAIVQKPFEELLTLKDKLKATKGRFETSTQRPRRHDDYEAIYGLSNRLINYYSINFDGINLIS